MKWNINKRVLWTAIFGVVFLGFIIFRLFFQVEKVSTKPEQTTEYHYTSSSHSSQSVEEKVLEEARATLEKPETSANSKVTKALQSDLNEVVTYLEGFKKEKSLRGIYPTYDHHLSLTNQEMLRTFATMIIVNYVYDQKSLQVYQSDAENVYQFTFKLSRGESDTLAFVGNYVPSTHQIEIVNMKGQPKSVRDDSVKFDPEFDPKIPTDSIKE